MQSFYSQASIMVQKLNIQVNNIHANLLRIKLRKEGLILDESFDDEQFNRFFQERMSYFSEKMKNVTDEAVKDIFNGPENDFKTRFL